LAFAKFATGAIKSGQANLSAFLEALRRDGAVGTHVVLVTSTRIAEAQAMAAAVLRASGRLFGS